MTTPGPEGLLDDLVEDFSRRRRAGEPVSVGEYVARNPDIADELRELLSAVLLMERLKPAPPPTSPTAPPDAGVPHRLGEYDIVREIGRGGMGVVYEARQEALGRLVAVKVLPRGLTASDALRERFRREALAAARLHHTNIVPVFAVGEDDGHCYYVMQLIDGASLAGGPVVPVDSPTFALKPRPPASVPATDPAAPVVADGHSLALPRGPEAFRRVAAIGEQVAAALDYAHGQGVIHRDIKPANLLLDKHGRAWVTDFGVARLREQAGITQTNELVGTLRYMAPERFSGDGDERADVYSLGATLYELLTGRPVFAETVPQRLIRLITDGSPTRPSRIDPTIPADLETIILKATDRDPAGRYATAGEMAADLRRFLDDRPVLARRESRWAAVKRWVRKHPALSAALSAVALLMVAITAVSLVAYRVSSRALAAEREERRVAEDVATDALDAMNRTFDRFAPTRLVATAADESGLTAQPALPPEAVSLLEDLLKTYERLAAAGKAYPRLAGPAAEANLRIGDIQRRLGRPEEAVAAYTAAVNLLAANVPPAESTRLLLARAYNERGRAHRLLQKPGDADRSFEAAVALLDFDEEKDSPSPERRYELARAFLGMSPDDGILPPGGKEKGGKEKGGRGDKGKGPPPDDERGKGRGKGKRPPPGHDHAPGHHDSPFRDPPHRRAARLLQALASGHPNVPEYQHLLACAYRDAPPHDRNIPEAVALLRGLIKKWPGVPDYRLDLCETLSRPEPHGDRGFPGDAGARRKRLEEAAATAKELTDRYPNMPDYAAAQARYVADLGIDRFRAGAYSEALQKFDRAVSLMSDVVKRHPKTAAYRFWLSLHERGRAKCLEATADAAGARAALERAAARMEALRQEQPTLRVTAGFLALAYEDLARLAATPGAAAAYRKKGEGLGRERAPDPFRR